MSGGLTIKAAQKLFFDSDVVLRSLNAAEVKVLSKFGAYVKTAAQRSMRSGGKKGKVSKPGEPPRTHGDRLLRKHLYSTFDMISRSAVIGPALLNGKARGNFGKTIPQTLEEGGQVNAREIQARDGRWLSIWDAGISPKEWRFLKQRTRKAEVSQRPYMKPAFDRERPKLMDMWRDAMNKV